MIIDTSSPMECLAAFALVALASAVSAVSLLKYIETLKRDNLTRRI